MGGRTSNGSIHTALELVALMDSLFDSKTNLMQCCLPYAGANMEIDAANKSKTTQAVRVRDFYRLMPEIFDIWPEHLQRCLNNESDLDLLPIYDRDAIACDKPTVIVCTEPYIRDVHVKFADLMARRPHSVWAHSEIFPGMHWQVPAETFYASNLVMTVRANPACETWQPSIKPYLAHALLGGWSTERGFLFQELDKSGMLPRCLANFQPRVNQFIPIRHADLFIQYRSSDLQYLDDDRFQSRAYLQGAFNSMVSVDKDQPICYYISQIIPWKVYQNTWIALVAETSTDSFFPTEKIGKPLLAAQPFVVFACTHFLQHLKDLGFRTFAPWIDESYDDIGDPQIRAKAVIHSLAQFDRLTDDEKRRVIQQLQPVLTHNRQLMLDQRHWHRPILDAIKKMLGQ